MSGVKTGRFGLICSVWLCRVDEWTDAVRGFFFLEVAKYGLCGW